MAVMSDKQLVRLCLNELSDKMGYGDRSNLSQSDLEHLCYLIEENTKVVISISTIKRVFNEKFERLPQIYTLDALTKFIGYSGWQDFKTKKANSESEQTVLSGQDVGKRSRGWSWYRNPAVAAGGIVLIAAANCA